MYQAEKDITKSNVELAKQSPELLARQEYERKFVVHTPQVFDHLKESAHRIEQTYVSHPDEEFSLRVRSEESEHGIEYTATLKDGGRVNEAGDRERLEVEVPISETAYQFYAGNTEFPTIKKLRAHYAEAVTVDFIEGIETPIVEVENSGAMSADTFLLSHIDHVREETGNTAYDNESLAHQLAGNRHERKTESLDTFSHRVVSEIMARYASGSNQVVVGLTGMSGSGKTTATKMIHDRIVYLFGQEYAPSIVSTDDYHRGKKWLEETYGAPWTEWDDPRVYNTYELAGDLTRLREGTPLIKRHFDFNSEETVYDEQLPVSPFVIVEGLYAGSPDLSKERSLHFTLPTGIATSIGRDVRRLVIENRANRAFPTPEARLKYQIESALPIYLSQERPSRNSFNASTRLMAERAVLLARLNDAY